MVKNKISYYRKKLGLSQTQLAKLCNTTQNTISSIETGQYSARVETALRLSKALNQSVEELFSL